MTQGTVKRDDVLRVYFEAVRSVVGPQWSPPGWEGGEARAREEAKLAFGKRLTHFAAWLYKQSSPTTGKEALEVLRANVERHTKTVFESTLTKKKYGPDDCLEWIQANGLAPTKPAPPAPKTLPPLPLESTPKVYRVDLRRGAENQRLAALTERVLSGMPGPGVVKTREQQLAALAELAMGAAE
jgi:hypothetical protein